MMCRHKIIRARESRRKVLEEGYYYCSCSCSSSRLLLQKRLHRHYCRRGTLATDIAWREDWPGKLVIWESMVAYWTWCFSRWFIWYLHREHSIADRRTKNKIEVRTTVLCLLARLAGIFHLALRSSWAVYVGFFSHLSCLRPPSSPSLFSMTSTLSIPCDVNDDPMDGLDGLTICKAEC